MSEDADAIPTPLRVAANSRPSQPAHPSQGPDWSREACRPFQWLPSRQLIRAMRDYQRALARNSLFGLGLSKFAVLRHRFWSMVTGADLPLRLEVGGGLELVHSNGIVIHPEAKLGPNCRIFQQVTIGTGPKPGVPRLGAGVDVAPGAKILGGVEIGDGARIGANAVVLSDVPGFAVAVGVPAAWTIRPSVPPG